MTAAVNAPVRRAPPEKSTADAPVPQPPAIDISMDKDIDRDQVIQSVDKAVNSDYLDDLAFAEEPVDIMIAKGSEKHAPLSVMCSVNGKGAEVFINGKWCEMTWLPVEQTIKTKRKYVEVMVRAKLDNVTTDTGTTNDEQPHNRVVRSRTMVNQISILGDGSRRAVEWFQRLMAEH